MRPSRKKQRYGFRISVGVLANNHQGYTVFSIPVGVVYRPNQAKVKNLKTKDYLGKARLVAASDRSNAFTGFAGSEIKNVSNLKDKSGILLIIIGWQNRNQR